MAYGRLGEPCAERICSLRGYHFVPADGLSDADPTTQGGSGDPHGDAAIGQRLGDYLLTGLIGVGGFGRVYRALQLPVGMPAAVKVLDLENGPASMAHLKQTKFEVEAQALARLSHPNIVRLYHYGLHRGAPYLAMELVEDATNLWGEIEARAAHERPFALDEIESILGQTMAALEAAHSRELIHRDIKPENIMLQVVPGHGLFVKLLDFGLAKFTADRTATSMLLGTPAYMAPEQLMRGRVGPWTDVYALGVVAFELLTGFRPFPAANVQETIAHKLEPTYDPWSRVEQLDLPPEVRAFFSRALASEVEARYLDIRHMREGLGAALEALRRREAAYLVPMNRLVEPTVLHAGPTTPAPVPDMTRRLARPPSDSERPLEPPPTPGSSARPEAGRPVSTPRAEAPPSLPVNTPSPKDTGAMTAGQGPWVSLSPTTRGTRRPSARTSWLLLVVLALVAGALVVILVQQSSRRPTAPTEVETPATTGALAPVRLTTGVYARGTAPHDAAYQPDETVHEVALGQTLLVDPTEVTQARWSERFGTRPWRHNKCGPACPVESVSWWDAVAFANEVSRRDSLSPCYELVGCRGTPGDGQFACDDVNVAFDCGGWRLPTEAEWEYLARAQSPPPDLSKVAWTARNAGADWGVEPCPGSSAGKSEARCGVHPVALREANAFGLYDMLGNVREWVQDGYDTYPQGSAQDPRGPERAGERVVRGGGFLSGLTKLRAAARDRAAPDARAIDLGFRLVRTVK